MAWQSLADAKTLAETESWNAAANRLYYSAFYIVGALMMTQGVETKTHSGLKTIFLQTFVKTGIVEKKWSEHYQLILNLRSRGDYEDLVLLNEDDIMPLIAETELFIEQLNKLIDQKN